MMGYYGYGNGMMGNRYYYGNGNGIMSFGYNMMSNVWSWITMLGIAVILTITVIGFIRYFRSSNRLVPVDNRNSAEQILNERYAKGEINTQEYQHRKALLKEN
jgi:Predicted membrane protein